MGKRKNTQLEAEGAEFLVLGHLLLNRISAFKAYVNSPGYDLIAADAVHNSSARIQVKSRLIGIEQYEDRWDLIGTFLSGKKP